MARQSDLVYVAKEIAFCANSGVNTIMRRRELFSSVEKVAMNGCLPEPRGCAPSGPEPSVPISASDGQDSLQEKRDDATYIETLRFPSSLRHRQYLGRLKVEIEVSVFLSRHHAPRSSLCLGGSVDVGPGQRFAAERPSTEKWERLGPML